MNKIVIEIRDGIPMVVEKTKGVVLEIHYLDTEEEKSKISVWPVNAEIKKDE